MILLLRMMTAHTLAEVPCPNCSRLVDPQNRYCDYCGVDLALAAVLAEQDMMAEDFPPGVPLAPEMLVPKVGDYLIEQGVLTQEDLQVALKYQQARAADGRSLLVGQALLELGLVDREALDQVITTQILQLHHALRETNRQLEQRVEERTQDLQKALDRLTELNQLKSNFIANISHELRTPLTHIKGYLDLLREEALGDLTAQQADALQVMQKAESRLERLIEDLIQFSLASRGDLSLNLDGFSLHDLVSKLSDHWQNRSEARGVHLQFAVSDDLPLVHADQEKIGWVLVQLLENAIKFTREHGRVVLKARSENDRVSVSVTDTGIGIPEDRIPEIFEAFHQLDGSATRRYGGTGLGLAMVRRIIEAHGSQIKVQSEVGQGSCFEFSLPIVKEASHRRRLAVESISSSL